MLRIACAIKIVSIIIHIFCIGCVCVCLGTDPCGYHSQFFILFPPPGRHARPAVQIMKTFDPTTSFLVKDLNPNTEYVFQLAARSVLGLGAPTPEVRERTLQSSRCPFFLFPEIRPTGRVAAGEETWKRGLRRRGGGWGGTSGCQGGGWCLKLGGVSFGASWEDQYLYRRFVVVKVSATPTAMQSVDTEVACGFPRDVQALLYGSRERLCAKSPFHRAGTGENLSKERAFW